MASPTISDASWNFHIGENEFCEMWLKDRTLSKSDLTHFQPIVVALNEFRLMYEIDKVIVKARRLAWGVCNDTGKVGVTASVGSDALEKEIDEHDDNTGPNTNSAL